MDTIKAISLSDLEPDAWRVILGREPGSNKVSLPEIERTVGYVFRGIDIRANAMMALPFEIRDLGGSIVDSSDDYQNAVGFLPAPGSLFALAEMALVTHGQAYFFKKPNLFGYAKGLRYLLPDTIQVEIDKMSGEPSFIRTIDANPKKYSQKDIAWIWGRDSRVEIGPPKRWPMKSVEHAAGVKLFSHKYSKLYWERGAIRATLLKVAGNPPPEEKVRIRSMWKRLMTGVKSVFGEFVINADKLEPVIIGDGLEGVSNRDLTEEMREEIATGLGIPHSMLFSNASNFATSERDALNFFDQTIIPDARLIEAHLNPQVFEPAGFKLSFTEENLDIYQEDEAERGAAMQAFAQAMETAQTKEMAMAIIDIFGVELSDESRQLIEEHFNKRETEKEENRQMMRDRLSQGPANRPENEEPKKPELPSERTQARSAEFGKLYRKAKKALESSGSAKVDFTSNVLDDFEIAYFLAELEEVKTIDELDWVFELEAYP